MTQWISLAGSSPTWAAMSVTACAGSTPELCTPDALALQIRDAADALFAEQFEAADITPASSVIG